MDEHEMRFLKVLCIEGIKWGREGMKTWTISATTSAITYYAFALHFVSREFDESYRFHWARISNSEFVVFPEQSTVHSSITNLLHILAVLLVLNKGTGKKMGKKKWDTQPVLAPARRKIRKPRRIGCYWNDKRTTCFWKVFCSQEMQFSPVNSMTIKRSFVRFFSSVWRYIWTHKIYNGAIYHAISHARHFARKQLFIYCWRSARWALAIQTHTHLKMLHGNSVCILSKKPAIAIRSACCVNFPILLAIKHHHVSVS